MTEPSDNTGPRSGQVLMRVLQETGAIEVLGKALRLAGLDEPPATRPELVRFVDGPLEQALVGCLHPSTAASVIATVRERLAEVDKSGTRPLSPVRDDTLVLSESMAETSPPPSSTSGEGAYGDLVSGAVHSRVTPTWGIRAIDPDAPPGSAVWIVVSNDDALRRSVAAKAPAEVEVVAVSSMAVLNGALRRTTSSASAVVLDAFDPSIKLARAVEALTEGGSGLRVLLWRMGAEERARLIETAPIARTWLPCEAEVTPEELVHLLGL